MPDLVPIYISPKQLTYINIIDLHLLRHSSSLGIVFVFQFLSIKIDAAVMRVVNWPLDSVDWALFDEVSKQIHQSS